MLCVCERGRNRNKHGHEHLTYMMTMLKELRKKLLAQASKGHKENVNMGKVENKTAALQ